MKIFLRNSRCTNLLGFYGEIFRLLLKKHIFSLLKQWSLSQSRSEGQDDGSFLSSTSAEAITSASVEENQEIFLLPPHLSLDLSSFSSCGVVLSRVSSSSRASVCFWHQGESEVVTAGWAADAKHVSFVAMETRMTSDAPPLRLKTSKVKYFVPVPKGFLKRKSFFSAPLTSGSILKVPLLKWECLKEIFGSVIFIKSLHSSLSFSVFSSVLF